MRRRIRAVIFDFDGTLLDTEWPDYVAWSEAYRSCGVELEIDVWAKVLGTSGSAYDLLGHLGEISGRRIDRDEMSEYIHRRASELILASGPMPGVLDYIEAVKRHGLRIGIASTSGCDWVEGHLSRLGLGVHFPVIRCAEWVENVKPAPDLYLAACDGLGVAPSEAIALEDSPNGITSANSAGVFSVAVPNQVSSMLDLSHANYHIKSLQAVPFDDLLRQIGAVPVAG